MSSLLIGVIFLAFVSLGLPDSLLGSAWPSMQVIFALPASYAGYVSMTISFMTVISALLTPTLIKKISTKWIVIISIFLTIIGLFGFSFVSSYWQFFIFAIPYGFGAGCIDASLNDYVVNHCSSSIMNFLHCFYGLGAVLSPNIMAMALKYARWNEGYRWVAYLQIVILFVCILSLPLWHNDQSEKQESNCKVSILDTIKMPGVVLTLLAFFIYCSAESIGFLWTSSYFASTKVGLNKELIASFGSLIFGGLMLGRLFIGFFANNLSDRFLIRLGTTVETIGVLFIILPTSSYVLPVIGFLIVGIGMGPIYPAIQHMAPINFGSQHSSTVISLQMASAYIGSTFMPAIFGKLQQFIGMKSMPWFLLVFALMCLTLLELAYKQIDK